MAKGQGEEDGALKCNWAEALRREGRRFESALRGKGRRRCL